VLDEPKAALRVTTFPEMETIVSPVEVLLLITMPAPNPVVSFTVMVLPDLESALTVTQPPQGTVVVTIPVNGSMYGSSVS